MAALRKLADEVDLSSEDTSLEPSAKRRKVEKITSESDFFADLFESSEAVAADEVDRNTSVARPASAIFSASGSRRKRFGRSWHSVPDGYCLFRPPALRQSGCFL